LVWHHGLAFVCGRSLRRLRHSLSWRLWGNRGPLGRASRAAQGAHGNVRL